MTPLGDDPATSRPTSPRRDVAERLSALAPQPGVYLMKNDQGEVIDVGKAASLRGRLRSYFGSRERAAFSTVGPAGITVSALAQRQPGDGRPKWKRRYGTRGPAVGARQSTRA